MISTHPLALPKVGEPYRRHGVNVNEKGQKRMSGRSCKGCGRPSRGGRGGRQQHAAKNNETYLL